MYEETLTKNTKRLLEALGRSGITKDFYLAGGTALALYLGHRLSIDLDWFSKDFTHNREFRRRLEQLGRLTVDSESEDTFNGSLSGVRISFFRYPYKLIFPKKKYKENIFLASEQDIACMKLDAIATRGTKKDFVDLHFLLEKYNIRELLSFLKRKYQGIEYNETHLLKSLVYFNDAEKTIMPKLLKPISWDEIKKDIQKKVSDFVKSL